MPGRKIPSPSGLRTRLVRNRMITSISGAALLACGISAPPAGAQNAVPSRGETIYLEKCAMCHLPSGLGAPPAFPPLAGSDWMAASRPRTIKAVVEGLEGAVTVNGRLYNNVMPAQMLNDADVAEVLTYVTNAWGNKADPFTAEEVKTARKQSRYATFEDLEKAAAYAPLPAAPAGWTLKEAVQLPVFCTRMAASGKPGLVYLLGERGIVYRMENGAVTPWIYPESYADSRRGTLSTMGLTVGPDGSLYVVSNQRVSGSDPVDSNLVTVWRSAPVKDGETPVLKAWLETAYPWGVGPFNHGVSHIAFGPDGMIYISSGSRTDGGEPGGGDRISTDGETAITACLWRVDPKSASPKIETAAPGLRNAYGFAWNDAHQLFTVSNGPDANAPEEMDLILPGHHYGFPYQYSNWPRDQAPYPFTPEAPAGLAFTHPVLNEGPDGGGAVEGGLATFDPHSSPAGMVWCGESYTEPLKNSFIVTRFGNLLNVPEDSGFDLLRVRPYQDRTTGLWRAKVNTLISPLGRPVDVLPDGQGGLYILEYTRPVNFRSRIGWMPGRVLRLIPPATPAPAPK